MSFQKFKIDSYCVGGRHRSATTKNYGDKTSKGSKVQIGYCSICNRKNTMTVSDNFSKNEGLVSFSKSLGRNSAKVGKKLATKILKKHLQALDITANTATAASRNPKAALSGLPQVINFYHTGEGLYLGKLV